ncbi:MAG: 30S ribosomal protein S12 methylthiotransferase RimO [Thermodesulfobacteriota bacterium]
MSDQVRARRSGRQADGKNTSRPREEKQVLLNTTVHLVSLGCPKNRVDSEYLLGLLAERGARVVEDPAQARVILINTCGFIRPAVEEAVETIFEMAAYKAAGSAQVLGVIGCLAERYREDLAKSLPEVDFFWGTGGLDRVPGLIEASAGRRDAASWPGPGWAPEAPGPRLRSAPAHTAYLKIAEGCSNACSYCLIPKLRGRRKSRPAAVLLAEAAALAAAGVKELILVAQDTTAYGRDLPGRESLARLLAGLAETKGLEWLRVMYAYPTGLQPELLEVMASEPKVCPYLDLPLQHASPAVLKRMRRGGPRDLSVLVRGLRDQVPGLVLRTTMMVGFPGETEADFRMLLDFAAQARFERLGVFKFSPEEGSAAAGFPDQVPQRIKENRRRKLMALQRRVSREKNRALVGQILPVLIEGVHPETDFLLAGRTRGMAPEIDGRVLINKGEASAGEIRNVLITGAFDYDLVGEIL